MDIMIGDELDGAAVQEVLLIVYNAADEEIRGSLKQAGTLTDMLIEYVGTYWRIEDTKRNFPSDTVVMVGMEYTKTANMERRNDTVP